MANVVKLKKGLDINLKGRPVNVVEEAALSEYFAIIPDDFHVLYLKL